MGPTEILCRHVVETRFEELPATAVEAAKIFIGDSLGVGVVGSRGPWIDELISVHRHPEHCGEARIWGRSATLPASAAAMVNAYQIHNSEFDCVHEAAVIHPMAVLLGATFAFLDRSRARDKHAFTGRELIVAATVGVDVACHLGVASRAPLRFFRPACAGALAATACIARLARLSVEQLITAMGITHAQLCGTMQAHTEGSSLLAMQVGFNARNAIIACDMALAGIPATRHVIEGPFGYLALFEGEHEIERVLPAVGHTWRIQEIAHKPYPSGRATHGVVDACLELQRKHGFSAADVVGIKAWVPSLTQRLVGRPVTANMTSNYARLCARYVIARALRGGTLDIEDFEPPALGDRDTFAMAQRIDIECDQNPDPNALTPITLDIELSSGTTLHRTIDVVYGNPKKPMPRDAHLAKLKRNLALSATPLHPQAFESLTSMLDNLETLSDVAQLGDCLVA